MQIALMQRPYTVLLTVLYVIRQVMSTKQYKSKLNNFNKAENGVNSGGSRSLTIPLRDTAVFRYCDCIRFIERNRRFKPTARPQYNTIKKKCQTKKADMSLAMASKNPQCSEDTSAESILSSDEYSVKKKKRKPICSTCYSR